MSAAVADAPRPNGDAATRGPASAARHFVVLGDSLSAGVGDVLPGMEALGAHDLVARVLRARSPRMRYTNLARRGAVTRAVHETQLPIAVNLASDVTSVMVGGNDILEGPWNPRAYERHVDALLAAFAGPGRLVLTATLPDFSARLPLPGKAADRVRHAVREANDIVRLAARRHGALLLEVAGHPAVEDRRFWSADGIHPSSLGYVWMARELVALLGERGQDAP